jgi:hypothetical protein
VSPWIICLTSVIEMSETIDMLSYWWNYITRRNAKLKFRTPREAAEFVRRVQRENGGPNEKIIAMRRRYEEVIRASAESQSSRSHEGENTAVRRQHGRQPVL